MGWLGIATFMFITYGSSRRPQRGAVNGLLPSIVRRTAKHAVVR